MPKDASMNSGHVESGLTAVNAYNQTTGACGGIDFWGNCWEWTSSTDADGLYVYFIRMENEAEQVVYIEVHCFENDINYILNEFIA